MSKYLKSLEYIDLVFDEERALYAVSDALIKNCTFDGPADGESALKETSNIQVQNCFMNLRYPFWHVTNGCVSGTDLTENCRAAFWYDKNLEISDCKMMGIKAIRECEAVSLKNTVVNSSEFIWKSKKLEIDNVEILGSEYPFFEVDDAKITKLKMKGKYSFQYCTDIEIKDSELDTKDAFWHSKNITIRDSVVKGEYLGWYSENLTFINCKIIGTQPLCYCKNLVLQNCTMENCDLSFERSSVHAEIKGDILSVKNPFSGKIVADSIGQIIIEENIVDKNKTEIIYKN